jgi:excisionase family DNA binding protein
MAMQTHEHPHPIIPQHTVEDPWLTLQQGATHVQAHEATLRREMKAGRLRFAKVGGRKSIRVRRSWLDAWLEGSTRPVEAA